METVSLPPFNQSLASVSLPYSFQSVTFGVLCSQSIEKVSLLLSQGMASLSLSFSLQSITFDVHCSQSIEKVSLPPFKQSVASVSLSYSIQSLSFGVQCSQSIERVSPPLSQGMASLCHPAFGALLLVSIAARAWRR